MTYRYNLYYIDVLHNVKPSDEICHISSVMIIRVSWLSRKKISTPSLAAVPSISLSSALWLLWEVSWLDRRCCPMSRLLDRYIPVRSYIELMSEIEQTTDSMLWPDILHDARHIYEAFNSWVVHIIGKTYTQDSLLSSRSYLQLIYFEGYQNY